MAPSIGRLFRWSTAAARGRAPWLLSGVLHAALLAAAALGTGAASRRAPQVAPLPVVLLAEPGPIHQPASGGGAVGGEVPRSPAAPRSERQPAERRKRLQRQRPQRPDLPPPGATMPPAAALATLPGSPADGPSGSPAASGGPGRDGPSAGGGGVSPVERARALGAYLQAVLGPINAHTTYPEEAERLGLEGRFVLRIAVDGAGRVLEAVLIGAEPHLLLKRSAFAALAAAAPLPPPPPELGGLVRVDVPFVYRIDG